MQRTLTGGGIEVEEASVEDDIQGDREVEDQGMARREREREGYGL